MNEVGEYLVTGKRDYRGHKPGTIFEARLDPGPERRAVDRGDIQLLRRIIPELQEGSYRLPDGWPPPKHAPHTRTNDEAPEGASLIGGGG